MLAFARHAAKLAGCTRDLSGKVVAKRSENGGLWAVIGIVVLVVLIPKEVWIALGILLAVAAAIFVGIKIYAAKKQPPPAPAATVHEPTLAEWMAQNHKPASTRKPAPPAAPAAALPRTVQPLSSPHNEPSGLVATDTNVARALREKAPPSPALAGQPEEWNAHRQGVIAANRARTQELRDKLPPGPARSNPEAQTPPASIVQPATPRTHSSSVPPIPASIPPAAPTPPAASSKPERSLGDFMQRLRGAPEDEGMYSVSAASKTPASHAIPPAPQAFRQTKWYGPGEAIDLAGLRLPGGMIYVGPTLRASTGGTDPALINPALPVAAYGDPTDRHTNYWASYSDLEPAGRRAYLRWLAEGRSNPNCDIGLVFLFFYGLERRIFVDAQTDPACKLEWPEILAELRRLLGVYGDRSAPFKRYAGDLLSWLELDGESNRLYEKPVPDFPRTYEVPPYVRLALGQAAVDRKPLPAGLALAWLRLTPDCYLRTAATRCPGEFARLFSRRYHELLGDGLVLPKNRTKLKFVYQAASGALRMSKITMGFGDVPDVTALTAPIKTLRAIAEQCTDELGAYSRLVGKEPERSSSLEAVLLLPASLWPQSAQNRLRELVGRMRNGQIALSVRELLSALGGRDEPATKEVVRALARALEGEQIGMEPFVVGGARTPGEHDKVVLFAQPIGDSRVGTRPEYQTGALTLQLAAALALADGAFHEREAEHLRREIESWSHLSMGERKRLHAHLQWLSFDPPTLTSLKKRLEPLPLAARESIAAFMASLAQSDGFVSPDEVKFLEKIYKALGVESKRVFSDVHAASTNAAPVQPKPAASKAGFQLDAKRIAALQADTARVSELLSKIFTEEVAPPATAAPEPVAEEKSLLSLDEPHAALLRLMLSRPSWSREELEDAAADLELMLDGALETINEASFDALDAPICEGTDPVEVNSDLLEKLEA